MVKILSLFSFKNQLQFWNSKKRNLFIFIILLKSQINKVRSLPVRPLPVGPLPVGSLPVGLRRTCKWPFVTLKRSNIFIWFAYQWYYWWIFIEKYYFISRGWIKMGWFASWIRGNFDHEWSTDWIQRLISKIFPKKLNFCENSEIIGFFYETKKRAL